MIDNIKVVFHRTIRNESVPRSPCAHIAFAQNSATRDRLAISQIQCSCARELLMRDHGVRHIHASACDVDQDTLDGEILLDALSSTLSSVSRLLDTYTT